MLNFNVSKRTHLLKVGSSHATSLRANHGVHERGSGLSDHRILVYMLAKKRARLAPRSNENDSYDSSQFIPASSSLV